MNGDINADGWCDWAYKGVDHSFPGNGGLECRNYLSITQRLLESVVACVFSVCVIIYAWPRLKLPEFCPSKHHRIHEPLGKRVLLFLMCLTFGIELGFKFATRQMIWIGNPCHIATMVQIYILAAPPSRVVTAVFRLHMHMLTGAPIAILFPVINTRLLPFEIGVYFLQHILMLVIPFYLLYIGDPFIPEPLGDFSWALSSLGLLYIYHFVPLQIVAYISHVNLNNMLCPAVSDPFHGQFYRVYAMFHQIVLILILGKVFVIIARAFRILPQPDPTSMIDKNSYESNTTKRAFIQYSAGDYITDGQNDCKCSTCVLNNEHKMTYTHDTSCHFCGDCNPSSFNGYSYRSYNVDSREFNGDCRGPDYYSTQHIVNGHLVKETKDDDKYCRRMPHDVSNHISTESRETCKNCQRRKIHFVDSPLSKPEGEHGPYNTKLVSDQQKIHNGHPKSH